ncbi:polysaccharide biosynthesis protein [Lacticaseibacillus paracasei subsp. paracasei Lpp126]|uniref:Polysaccharide biosynthesis protein n=1 Tax=Lacticaseibacillus paracasei subsp. paracasei Lpp126 TaxID=1256206 RepID=S2RQB2_LACPA|nr:stealth conserved region 3 domain-containing protein [Lacticaseibacillus paracasei]EPC79630.1 polysaccharide biosynthesis protein [Lacticaseibacillus paracasei subsp. paracasei Lpp126]MCU6432064.1 stealth conserved region 3 domain-containing protein [Lacticaseibacillus paracasei]
MKEKSLYLSREKHIVDQYADDRRYREEVSFKYWFRSVEKNCPWVHKIYLVTNGQIPEWLNTDNPKLSVVLHSQILGKEVLPTFNSNAIEMGIGRIPGLSENFVLFNDDMYVIHQTNINFFFENGLPKDEFILYPSIPQDDFDHIMFNNLILVNNSSEVQGYKRRNFLKLFNWKYGVKLVWQFFAMMLPGISGFRNPHVPISYKKSQFLDISKRFQKDFKETETHRFRNNKDISNWFVRYMRLLSGQFVSRSPKNAEYLSIDKNALTLLEKFFKHKKVKLLCLNDDELDVPNNVLIGVNDFFQKQFPHKSSFEV